MASYLPLGSLLLVETLTEDPFGTVHRGLERDGSDGGRSVLVRRYRPDVVAAGLSDRLGEVRRNLLRLERLPAFQGCRLVVEGAPHLVWPYSPGRTLTQALQRAEAEGIPFGPDQALFLGWSLAHHVSQLHRVDLPLGVLTPDRVWIGFDGCVQLLDTAAALPLRDALPSLPEARERAAPYRQGPGQEGLPHDLFQLGALLFEMLTHHPLPLGEDLEWHLLEARQPGLDGQEAPLSEGMVQLLRRLLGLEPGFASLEILEREVECFLFDGDYNPTTFGLAFTMHTLFRQELMEGCQLQAREQADSGVFRALESLSAGSPSLPAPQRRRSGLLVASLVLAVSAGSTWALLRPGSVPQVASTVPGTSALQPLRMEVAPAPAPEPRAMPSPDPTPVPGVATPVKPALAPPHEQPPRTPVPAAPTAALPAPQAVPVPLPAPVPAPVPAAAVVRAPESASAPPTVGSPRLLGTLGSSTGTPLRIRVFVDETGRVRQALVQPGHGLGPEAEAKAYALALQARFEPARRNNQPQRAWTELQIRFP